jgi:hypothetical protein
MRVKRIVLQCSMEICEIGALNAGDPGKAKHFLFVNNEALKSSLPCLLVVVSDSTGTFT